MDSRRFVPFKVNFDLVKKMDKYLNWLLYFATFLGIILLVMTKLIKPESGDEIALNINIILGIFSLLYFLGDLVKRFLLQFAEQKRRKDFIDNSLHTQLSEQQSEGYFTNERIDPGVYKMGVNCFESSYFSMIISGKMILPLSLKSLAIILLFSALFMTTDKVTVATILQFALPYTMLQQTIIVIIYYFQISSIFNYFKLLFGSAQENMRDLLIIHNVISYESTISWAGLILDNDIYEESNEHLSENWENIKTDHHITI